MPATQNRRTIKGESKGEICPKYFLVYYEQATSWGSMAIKSTIKYFNNSLDAEVYALSLIADLKNAEELEDWVIIKTEKLEVIETFRFENGEILNSKSQAIGEGIDYYIDTQNGKKVLISKS